MLPRTDLHKSIAESLGKARLQYFSRGRFHSETVFPVNFSCDSFHVVTFIGLEPMSPDALTCKADVSSVVLPTTFAET